MNMLFFPAFSTALNFCEEKTATACRMAMRHFFLQYSTMDFFHLKISLLAVLNFYPIHIAANGMQA